MGLYVEANSADEAREICEGTMKVARDHVSTVCEGAEVERGEPVTVAPVHTVPITRSFNPGASAC